MPSHRLLSAVLADFGAFLDGHLEKAAMTAQLVTDAFVMAIWRRDKPDALLHHSDRGSQPSEQFQKLMADHGVVCLMSQSGQRRDGELLLVTQNRADSAQAVSHTLAPPPKRESVYLATLLHAYVTKQGRGA